MACRPSRQKCEWTALRGLVDHYNSENQTAYAHERCLDRENLGTKQPELLCIDPNSNSKLVIENKRLIWASDDAKQDAAWVRLMQGIFRQLGEELDDAPYTLRITSPDAIDDARIGFLAKEIVLAASQAAPRLREGEYCHLPTSVGATLEKEYSNDREGDEPATGLRVHSIDHGSDGLVDRSKATLAVPTNLPVEVGQTLGKIYAACEEKFSGYSDCTRLLELRTESGSAATDLGVWWWSECFKRYPPPSSIDEIWFTFNYGEGHDGWMRECIYKR